GREAAHRHLRAPPHIVATRGIHADCGDLHQPPQPLLIPRPGLPYILIQSVKETHTISQTRDMTAGGAEREPGGAEGPTGESEGLRRRFDPLHRAGDTAWALRCSAGRIAGSAGLRRRSAQLRWAMRGQDPLKEQRVPRRTSGCEATGPA